MFYDIVFDLIKIIRSLKASQNDCQILIFVESYLCSCWKNDQKQW